MKNILYALVAIFAFILVATAVHAVDLPATYPGTVTGTVTDNSASPVEGATVDVTCTHLGLNTTMIDTTLSDGSYFVVFDNQNLCDFNDALFVQATKDSAVGTNTGNMCSSEKCFIPVAIVDVTIPEFGLVGAMIVLLAGIGIVAYRRH
jgi:hypothetical protein